MFFFGGFRNSLPAVAVRNAAVVVQFLIQFDVLFHDGLQPSSH